MVPSYASLFNVSIDICSFSGFYYNFYKIPHSLSCDRYTPLDDDATKQSAAAKYIGLPSQPMLDREAKIKIIIKIIVIIIITIL